MSVLHSVHGEGGDFLVGGVTDPFIFDGALLVERVIFAQ